MCVLYLHMDIPTCIYMYHIQTSNVRTHIYTYIHILYTYCHISMSCIAHGYVSCVVPVHTYHTCSMATSHTYTHAVHTYPPHLLPGSHVLCSRGHMYTSPMCHPGWPHALPQAWSGLSSYILALADHPGAVDPLFVPARPRPVRAAHQTWVLSTHHQADRSWFLVFGGQLLGG